VTSSNTHPGVITGITIKGDVGSSTTTTTSTSTSTTTTDISTTIIETQDTATRLREEATKVKNVGETKIEEFTEQITIYKKTVEETTHIISESKTNVTTYRSKEKEINNKISTTTDTTEIESLKKDLINI
jgi:predicted  nucleic acid-binding Zn-ribbon protein